MRLSEATVHERLAALDAWQPGKDKSPIRRDFKFSDFHQTMAFVNAVAWIAHGEDHHPEMEVGYTHSLIEYTSHTLGGLSEKDFICACNINALLTKA